MSHRVTPGPMGPGSRVSKRSLGGCRPIIAPCSRGSRRQKDIFWKMLSFDRTPSPCGDKKHPQLGRTHGRHLATHRGLIPFTLWYILRDTMWHCWCISQQVANDYNFIADVWKIMTDEVSLLLSYFFCFGFILLINNSSDKITVPEKSGLFHQPLQTMLNSAL